MRTLDECKCENAGQLLNVLHAVVQISQRQSDVLLVILPIRQFRALEVIKRFLSQISLRLHQVDLAVNSVFVGTLSI